MGSPKERRPCADNSHSPDSPVEKVNIYCKVIKTVAMKVKRSATVKRLKVMLCKKEHISENFQEVFLAGERLEDGRTLIDCGINQDSTLHLFNQSSAAMKLFVKIPSKQEPIMLRVKTWDTVQIIKTLIQTKERSQSDQFSLYFNGKQLNDDSTLASLNIRKKSTLYLVCNPIDELSICVKTQTGSIQRLEVRLSHTVEDTKAIVKSVNGIPVSDFRLTYAGKELEGRKTLAYYDIKEESVLDISPPLFEIFVTDMTQKTVTVNVDPRDTVRDLKDKIFQKTGYPVNMQRIIYAGSRLEEGQDLASYGIHKGSSLRVMILGRPCFVCRGIKPEPA